MASLLQVALHGVISGDTGEDDSNQTQRPEAKQTAEDGPGQVAVVVDVKRRCYWRRQDDVVHVNGLNGLLGHVDDRVRGRTASVALSVRGLKGRWCLRRLNVWRSGVLACVVFVVCCLGV